MAFDVKQLKVDNKGITPQKPLTPEQQKAVEERATLQEERLYQRGTVTIRDLIAPSAFEVKPDYLQLGNKFARTLFVVTYPRYVGIGWGAPIINYNSTLDVGMFFYPVKSEVILKQLKNKVGIVSSQIISDSEKGAPRDPLQETALRDIEQLRDDLTQGIEHFFQFAFYVTLYADNKEDLDKRTEEVESIFGARLIHSKRGFYQAEQGFNSTIPLGNDELMITFNMNTSPIASSFPFISSDLTSDRGILYGINRHNNSLVLFDRFSLQNANAVVFATSGAGKSYAVKLEVLRSMMMGTDVIIIDPEMEYRTLSDAVGGTYVNVSLASDSKLNPFDLPRPVGESTSVEDILRSAVITIKGLLRIMIGQPIGQSDKVGFTPEEDSMLDRAIIEAYAKKDITADLTLIDLQKAEYPIMQDLQDVLDGMEGSKDLVARLRKYTEGTFAGLLNSPTTVEMNNQLVVFSVRDLEDELRPMAIYTIVNYIWNVTRSVTKKRILAIDEAWWLMQYEDSAKFIFALVKRARKYYLGVTTITQDVNDFLNNQYGRAIVTNSAIQLLMKQSPAGADVVAQTFNLTQSEKYLLLEAGVGEGIFFAGQKHAAIKIVASYTEDRLITTNPEQLLEIERARKDFEASFNGAAEAVGVKTAQEREAELKKVKASVDSAGATVISMPEEPVAGATDVAESSVARRDQENFVASNRPAQAAGDGSVPDLFESVDAADPANDKKDGEQSAEDAVKAILQKENKG